MKIKIILLSLLISTHMFVTALAQMPLVYDVENTGVDCPLPPLYTFSQLPTIQSLPDPFAWSDGRGHVASFSDWRCRRAEISAELQRYELGTKPAPPAPGNLQASYSNGVLTITVTEGANSLTMTAAITLPAGGTGPYPAIIGVGGGSGSLPADIFTGRGVATIAFNYGEVAPWTQGGRGQGAFYTLYPDTKVGYFIAWAWGISRLIDGLELVQETANIDLAHLGVTGCSFAGKIALFAGALDERIALTIPQEPGGGGDAAWRVTETLSGSREVLRSAQSYGWYSSEVSQFNSAVTKLPYDHHEVMAMIAPRALFVLGNPTQEWLADESGYVASRAAHEVWKALGVPDRFGFSKVGDHNHCALPDVQRPDVGAFVDKFLLGLDTVNTDIAISPFNTNLSGWITWATPTLTNSPSYFEQTSLIYPANTQADIEGSITFTWHKVEDAAMYYLQLSQDPTFTSVSVTDSTSDTTMAIPQLLEGKTYYWRVQVKGVTGVRGPWSQSRNFTTYIALPGAPQLVAATPVPNRSGYIKLLWNTVDRADKYILQVANDAEFNSIIKTDSTTFDTSKILTGYVDDRKYYWRVQSKNIAGSSVWNVSSFAILKTPSDLVLQISSLNGITLTWKDNSAAEDGYLIERKQNPDTLYMHLDTVNSGLNEYTDNNVEQTKTYTYRIKAYTGLSESAPGNEATLLFVGVNELKEIPKEYSLSQNYPNPFNPSTKIKFSLLHTALTKIIIYDILGREAQTLINRELEAGNHEISIDINNLPSGVYLYRIQSGSFTDTKKMILQK